jgi:hypothetical protein
MCSRVLVVLSPPGPGFRPGGPNPNGQPLKVGRGSFKWTNGGGRAVEVVAFFDPWFDLLSTW